MQVHLAIINIDIEDLELILEKKRKGFRFTSQKDDLALK